MLFPGQETNPEWKRSNRRTNASLSARLSKHQSMLCPRGTWSKVNARAHKKRTKRPWIRAYEVREIGQHLERFVGDECTLLQGKYVRYGVASGLCAGTSSNDARIYESPRAVRLGHQLLYSVHHPFISALLFLRMNSHPDQI